MNQVIRIHEFSTGIEIYGTPDNWHVGGFTGKYINSTLSSIPASVQDTISIGYFKIAQGKSSSKPAVVGREIIRDNEQWSVVAVVISGEDNRGRFASLYRYFLCEGVGNIRYILQWMYQEKGYIIIFDPFDTQNIGYPHQYQITSSKSIILKPQLQNLLSDLTPIIIPFDEPCTPLVLNQMANHLNNPTSWAFNVTGLGKPRSFQIIQAADSQSEAIIKQIISKTSKQPQFHDNKNKTSESLTQLGFSDETKKIITAIKGLTTRKTFTNRHLSTIENELANPKFNQQNWEYLFDILGANDAIREKIYAPSPIRLLTLRAMVLPETLPELLTWLEQASDQKKYNISSTFQSEVLNHHHNAYQLVYLRERLIDGVKFIITYLAKEPKLLEPTIELLKDEKGIWRHYYKNQVMIELDQDFKLRGLYYNHQASKAPYKVLNHPSWQKIYLHLTPYWQPNASVYQITEYQPIANLFYELSKINRTMQELRLHALFTYISHGIIPKKLFIKLKRHLNKPRIKRVIYINVYGIDLQRQVPWSEKLCLLIYNLLDDIFCLIKKLWQFRIPLPLVLILMNCYLVLGILAFNRFLNKSGDRIPASKNIEEQSLNINQNLLVFKFKRRS